MIFFRPQHFKCFFGKTQRGFAEDLFSMRQLIKPYLVQNTSLIMSIFPIKGRYQKKNDFRAVMKVGAVVLEFIPKIKDNSDKNSNALDWSKKNYFVLSLNQIGDILSLNEYKIANNNITMELTNPIRPVVAFKKEDKRLQISKNIENEFFTFALIAKEISEQKTDSLTQIYSIDVNVHEFTLIQEFCKFLLPHLLGWHLLSEPKRHEEEF